MAGRKTPAQKVAALGMSRAAGAASAWKTGRDQRTHAMWCASRGIAAELRRDRGAGALGAGRGAAAGDEAARPVGRDAVVIYSLDAEIVSRGKGDSAVGAAAYQSRSRMVDARTGEVHDYTPAIGANCCSRASMRSRTPRIGRATGRACGAMSRNLSGGRTPSLPAGSIIALPHELTTEQNRYVLQDLGAEEFHPEGADCRRRHSRAGSRRR